MCVDAEGRAARIPWPPGWSGEDLVHPHLGVAAHLAAIAHGELPLHAGSCAVGEGGWVLLGDHDHGKSALLATLSELDVTPLADDLTVLRGDAVCAGPRCLDLRPAAAQRLGLGEPARGGDRRRVTLDPVDAEHPLRGFVHLRWGDRVQVRALAPSERMQRLLAHVAHLRHLRPARLMALAAIPAHELTRPRDWAHATRAALAARELMAGA